MKTLLILLTFAAAAAAQNSFTLEWSTLDGGGGRSPEPAEFTLEGSSVGQFEAGSSAAPGEFSVAGGFWSFDYYPPPLPEITMRLEGGAVTLTWPAAAAPVILESSGDLELWAPVDPQPAAPFFQEPEGARRFYRLVPSP